MLLVDGQSFYASVEKAAYPEYKDRPVAVADPERRRGIILAACPIAKKYGVTTASRVFEALAICKDLVIIKPRMQRFSHDKTLRASLYTRREDIEVVLLELCIEVCRRARRLGVQGRVVSLGMGETDGKRANSINRQLTLTNPTSLTQELSEAVMRLFNEYWQGLPASHLMIALNQLSSDRVQQLDLFDNRHKIFELEKTTDAIKDRFGDMAIMRASSMLEAGVARERAGQIGGHYK
ncbi:Y-family DNA polymerase [Paenibacillus agaridevorans]|uniref:Y-family DNA polymerase n=1 Tax=Paenibacillus agaridevorans TaxID=171404 RepID=UPI000D598467|nr:hypothetical protein [Paenibacillus agaridevorans]